MREGKADFSAGRYETARALYERACALMHTPRCLRSLATAELRAGRALDAYGHFRELFADPNLDAALDADAQADARAAMKEAYAATGHVMVHAPEGVVVTLDGQSVVALQGEVRLLGVGKPAGG